MFETRRDTALKALFDSKAANIDRCQVRAYGVREVLCAYRSALADLDPPKGRENMPSGLAHSENHKFRRKAS